jgi:hypothetical protein
VTPVKPLADLAVESVAFPLKRITLGRDAFAAGVDVTGASWLWAPSAKLKVIKITTAQTDRDLLNSTGIRFDQFDILSPRRLKSPRFAGMAGENCRVGPVNLPHPGCGINETDL